MTRRLGRLLGLVGLLGLAGSGLAGYGLAGDGLAGDGLAPDCAGFSERSLSVSGFGRAYFAELRLEGEVAELYGGICLESEARSPSGEPRWTLRGERVRVDTRPSPALFSLAQAALAFEGWTVAAAALSADGRTLALQDVRFRGHRSQGRAEAARYDLDSGELALTRPALDTPDYRLTAARAKLDGELLKLEAAVATTCREGDPVFDPVSGDPPLRLTAPRAEIDLVRGRMRLHGAALEVGTLALPLGGELELAARSLADLELPFSVGVLDRLGLSILVSGLPLSDVLSLEAGVVGLDGLGSDGPAPAGVFLLSLAQPGLRAAVGRSRFGPQADVEAVTALAPGLRAVYGVHNRHWPDADFLHEGFMRLEAESVPFSLLLGDRVELTAAASLAASSQTLAGAAVVSARGGLAFGLGYRAPPLPLGQFAFAYGASYSLYPQAEASQYGLRLRPSWSGRLGPLTLAFDYDRQVTDSGSPFSPRLDRLQPIDLLAFSARLQDEVPGRASSLSLQGRYDFLAATNPWRRLELSAAAEDELAGWRVRPSLRLEAAGLLSPFYDPEVEAFAEAALALARGGWDVGMSGRYAFVSRGPGGVERLELSASLPLRGPRVRLQPFLALDAADLVTGRGGLRLAGHGLELEWQTCCGPVTLGYRLHRGRFTTSLGLGLDDSP